MENKSKILSSTIEVINQRGGNNQTVSVKTEGEDLYSAQFMVNVNEPSFIILYVFVHFFSNTRLHNLAFALSGFQFIVICS